MEQTFSEEMKIKIVILLNINFRKIQKMRNMKSLHIFPTIVIKREEKFQESLWEDGRSKVTFGI